LFDAEITGKRVGEARGAVGTGSDLIVKGLDGRKHGAVDASLLEALPETGAGDRVESFFEIHKAAIQGPFVCTCLVDEGCEGEDMVSGAVVTAEAGLKGGADIVVFGPGGEAGFEDHGIEF